MDKQKQEKIMERARMKVAISNFKEEDLTKDTSKNKMFKIWF